eukprot:scaffold145885_cov38-Tisochrysis_lutea.AAC.1
MLTKRRGISSSVGIVSKIASTPPFKPPTLSAYPTRNLGEEIVMGKAALKWMAHKQTLANATLLDRPNASAPSPKGTRIVSEPIDKYMVKRDASLKATKCSWRCRQLNFQSSLRPASSLPAFPSPALCAWACVICSPCSESFPSPALCAWACVICSPCSESEAHRVTAHVSGNVSSVDNRGGVSISAARASIVPFTAENTTMAMRHPTAPASAGANKPHKKGANAPPVVPAAWASASLRENQRLMVITAAYNPSE